MHAGLRNPILYLMLTMMQFISELVTLISLVIAAAYFDLSSAVDCGSDVFHTITVDKNGHGNFTTVQGAIDSIPSNNAKWIRISVEPGIYTEQVTIDRDKPCIILKGVSSKSTSIQYGAHAETNTSATFNLLAENFVAEDISFKNTYDDHQLAGHPSDAPELRKPAVAAQILGDKAAFYSCSFFGLQDTLWDEHGRHYFETCYVEGTVDFIFGNGQSIYNECIVNVTAKGLTPQETHGYITAQRRESPNDPSGFVFKGGAVIGDAEAYLGRAYGPYSTVILDRTRLSQNVVPQGWDAWGFVGQESNFTYVEVNCYGPGSDTSKRVTWEKNLSISELQKFTQLSFIDSEGWIAKQPKSPIA